MSAKSKINANVPCDLISNTENNDLFRTIGNRCSTLASGVVQLYLADSPDRGRWNKRCCGVACFVKDNEMKSYFIRVFDIQAKKMLWEQELYFQFRYKTPRDFFHTFEADNFQAALNFASEDEARKFEHAVVNKLRERSQRRRGDEANTGISESKKNNIDQGRERSKNKGNTNQLAVPNIAPTPPLKTVEYDRETTKCKKATTVKDKKGKYSKVDISAPSDFRHVSHLGWDPDKGFDMDNLNGDMKQLFQSVGIKPGDEVDKSTVEFIYNFVDKNGGIEAVRKEMANRPLPPSISAPPPPNRPLVKPPTPNRTPPPTPPSTRRKPPPAPTRSLPKVPSNPPPRLSPSPSPTSRAPPPPPPGSGKSLPPVPPAPPAPPTAPPPPTLPPPSDVGERGGASDSRGDLLKAIAGGAKLKKVSPSEKPAPQEESGGLVGALQQELIKLREKMRQDEEVEGEDSFDDEDWDD